MDRIPMTREGYEKLKADLYRMENIEMIEITKRVAALDIGQAELVCCVRVPDEPGRGARLASAAGLLAFAQNSHASPAEV